MHASSRSSPSPSDPFLSQLDKDDMVYMEAYDKILESWLTFIQDDEHFPRGCFVQPAIQVFNSYIQCHLAAPDGTRNLVRLCQCADECLAAPGDANRSPSMVIFCEEVPEQGLPSSSWLPLTHSAPPPPTPPVSEWHFISRGRRDQRAAGGRQGALL